MAESLIDALKSHLTGAVMDQVGKQLGLTSDKAGNAIGTTAATLLAALTQKSALPGGAEQILGLVRNLAPAGGTDIFSQLPDILGSSEKRGEMEKKGGDLVSQILGPNLGSVLGALGGVLGLGKGVVTPLLGMVAPLLMSLISKQVLGQGLGAQGLTNLLAGQTGFLKGALPAELTKSLGINSLADLGTAAASAAGHAAHDASRTVGHAQDAVRTAGHAASHTVKTAVNNAPSSFPGWLLPLLGLIAFGLLAMVLLQSWSQPAAAPEKVEHAAPAGVAHEETPSVKHEPIAPVVTLPKEPATEIVEEVDIIETVKNRKFTTLAQLLTESGLVEALKAKGPFTVFAPTDEAFRKIDPAVLTDLLKPENKAKLIEILKYHVIANSVPAANALTLDGQAVETLGGAKAPITVKDGKLLIGDATVTQGDIKTKNGIIHEIDSVLLPPAK